MKKFLGAVAFVFAPTLALAAGASDGPDYDHRALSYAAWHDGFFVRGGYGFHAHAAGISGSLSAPMGAAGYRHTISLYGRSRILFEMEGVYVRDSESITDGVNVAKATVWGVSGLAGFRWQYDTRVGVSPFVSASVGPNYSHARLEFGPGSNPSFYSIADGGWAFGYSGRAGIEASLSDRVSIEAAYRYLGATKDVTDGVHAAEIGLNFNW